VGWQNDPIVEAKPKWETDTLVAPAGKVPAPGQVRPAIVIRAGVSLPKILTEAVNPYSAGLYPLGRHFSVGDAARYRRSDLLTKLVQKEFTRRVTRVDIDNDRVEINDGAQVWDLAGNVVSVGGTAIDAPQQFLPAELYVGKKWAAMYAADDRRGARKVHLEFHIPRREKVAVPAGEFFAFKLVGHGWLEWRDLPDRRKSIEIHNWLLPALNFPIKHERVVRDSTGKFFFTDVDELVSLRQLVFRS
jgi:hypothetical protein